MGFRWKNQGGISVCRQSAMMSVEARRWKVPHSLTRGRQAEEGNLRVNGLMLELLPLVGRLDFGDSNGVVVGRR